MYKFFFSDWINIWFILYKFNIINFNPKIVILIGIIENIICLGYLFKLNINNIKYYKKLVIYFIIKLVTFYLLQDTNYKLNDFMAGIVLYIIYNIYLKLFFNESIIEYYKDRLDYYENLLDK